MSRINPVSILFVTICFLYNAGCQSGSVRIAHFNIKEFSLQKINEVDQDGIGRNPQLVAAASIIKHVRPDILLLQEIDHDYTGGPDSQPDISGPAKKFIKNYLSAGQNSLSYEYIFSAPCNTGILSGFDLDSNGEVAQNEDIHTDKHGGDSHGWGTYPGQYSMVLLSRYPLDTLNVRTFQNFRWKDLPGNHIPSDFYSPEEIEILRLSSKSHWDVPVIIGSTRLHLLTSHPTPPVFDGPEDRNGRRNFDEVKFWKLYLNNDKMLYDDKGKTGGYASSDPFIIAGDLNADPDADSDYDGTNAIMQLLTHPLIQDTHDHLTSEGSAEGREKDKRYYTVQFGQNNRLRIDYLLVSKNINVIDGAVFWPESTKNPEQSKLSDDASDHRLIWLDIDL